MGGADVPASQQEGGTKRSGEVAVGVEVVVVAGAVVGVGLVVVVGEPRVRTASSACLLARLTWLSVARKA